MKTLTLLLTVVLISQCLCDETIEVSLKQGVVFGKVEKTLMKNEKYFSFKGIPFAEPPVGELRFLVRGFTMYSSWKALNQSPCFFFIKLNK